MLPTPQTRISRSRKPKCIICKVSDANKTQRELIDIILVKKYHHTVVKAIASSSINQIIKRSQYHSSNFIGFSQIEVLSNHQECLQQVQTFEMIVTKIKKVITERVMKDCVFPSHFQTPNCSVILRHISFKRKIFNKKPSQILKLEAFSKLSTREQPKINIEGRQQKRQIINNFVEKDSLAASIRRLTRIISGQVKQYQLNEKINMMELKQQPIFDLEEFRFKNKLKNQISLILTDKNPNKNEIYSNYGIQLGNKQNCYPQRNKNMMKSRKVNSKAKNNKLSAQKGDKMLTDYEHETIKKSKNKSRRSQLSAKKSLQKTKQTSRQKIGGNKVKPRVK